MIFLFHIFLVYQTPYRTLLSLVAVKDNWCAMIACWSRREREGKKGGRKEERKKEKRERKLAAL